MAKTTNLHRIYNHHSETACRCNCTVGRTNAGVGMILVSACLIGLNCRYDGEGSLKEELLELVLKGEAIPVCPETMGGLSIPRDPAERVGDKVISKVGIDVTDEFRLGAEKTLSLALINKVEKAILKSKSPSCGVGFIYDGTHSRTLIEGNGMTAELLMKHGIIVENEN